MRKLRGPKGNMDKCRDRTAKSLGKSHRRYAEAVLLNSLHKTPHVFRQYYTPAHLLPPRLPQNYRGIFVKKNRNYNTHPFSYHFPLTTSPSLSLSPSNAHHSSSSNSPMNLSLLLLPKP